MFVDRISVEAVGNHNLHLRRPARSIQPRELGGIVASQLLAMRRMGKIGLTIARRRADADVIGRRVADHAVVERRVQRPSRVMINRVHALIGRCGIVCAISQIEASLAEPSDRLLSFSLERIGRATVAARVCIRRIQ